MAPVSVEHTENTENTETTTKPAKGDISRAVQVGFKSMNFPEPPLYDDKEVERHYKLGRLAGAFRIFGKLGFDEGISGHSTLRDPILTDCFWVNPLGLAFGLTCVSDLLLVNSAGDIIAGGRPNRQIYNTAAFAIHHALHMARPDVNAACHAHSLYGKAFSAFGRPLDCIVQDACAFYEDLAVYPDFGGVVLSGSEGENIAKYLGNCKAVLMQNHGPITVGETIEEAVAWYIFLDRLCHVQLLADAAMAGTGQPPKKIGHAEAIFTRNTTGTHAAGWNGAQMYYDLIDAETNKSYLN